MNCISLQGEAVAISLLRQQKYHAVKDCRSLKTIRKRTLTKNAHLQKTHTYKKRTLTENAHLQKQKKADTEINPYRLFHCPLAFDAKRKFCS